MDDLSPFTLSWADVDPQTHPFDPAAAAGVVRSLPPAREMQPKPKRLTTGARESGERWVDAMATALVGVYGRWVVGWRWSVGEGSEYDCGPVTAFCCAAHSITTPDETLDRVTEALVEWRTWLAELAGHFERFLPIPAGAPAEEQFATWERAVAHLVTVVAARTRGESAWFGCCQLTLSWFLERAGVPTDRHDSLIDSAIGGRFESWIEPDPTLVRDVAGRLATGVAGRADG